VGAMGTGVHGASDGRAGSRPHRGVHVTLGKSPQRPGILGRRSHLARAVLEATAFQTREVVEAMEKDAHIALASLRVDGGMVANELLMQFQADILDRKILRPRVNETTALGAAYAAGLAVGWLRDLNEVRAAWTAERTWSPHMDSSVREESYRLWKKAVGRAFDWI